MLGRLTTLDGALAPDHSISRRHASITRRGDGAFEVVDEHSRNGTFVNGDRLETPRVLRTGDELRIGGTVFVATAPAASDTAPSSGSPALAAPATEVVVETGKSGSRLALRLELDADAGELIVAIDNGATVRIVRGSDGWHLESS